MNKRTLYTAAGGVGAFAIILYYVIFSNGTFSEVNNRSNQSVSNNTLPITLSIKDIVPQQGNNHSESIEVAFNVHNPNQGTAILEAVQYNIFVEGKRIASGNIGNKLEGFLASSAEIYPIIGKESVILKDKQLADRKNSTPDAWTKILEGKARYLITGTYSYKQLSGLQANSEDKNFNLVFP